MTTLQEGKNFSRKISTENPKVQRLFDKGLNYIFGFHHEEAIKQFEKAIQIEDNLAIAYWGISCSYNINYNNPIGLNRKKSFENFKKAFKLKSNASQIEEEIINTLKFRFEANDEGNDPKILEKQYSKKTKELYHKYPNDTEIIWIYVESVMNCNPCKLWNKDQYGNFDKETIKIQIVLEKILEYFPFHPGLIHLYIHLMELSPNPEKAFKFSNNLKQLNIQIGHLMHMPSHIDFWMGNYEEAIKSNEKAISIDEKFIKKIGIKCNFYKFYRMHNIHFCIWSCMFAGHYNKALQYATIIQNECSEKYINKSPGAIYLDGYNATIWHVFIRFGKWNEIIQKEITGSLDDYIYSITIGNYAKGIAYASLGLVEQAEKYQNIFLELLQNPGLEIRKIINNIAYSSCGDGVLYIAKYMLFGEIYYRKGNYDSAFYYLRKAVDCCDNLVYDEPWAWMVPPRHALGALLHEQGKIEEAIMVFKKDLSIYKDNLWALGGLLKCYKDCNVNFSEIHNLEEKMKRATEDSKIDFKDSCYCSRAAGASAPNFA